METNDINKAAYLMYKTHRITIINGTPCRFVFDPVAEADAREYDSGVMVSAAIYADTLARLRRLVAERRSGR